MTTKIGTKEVVFRDTFIVRKNETAEFEFSPTHPEAYLTVTHNKALVRVKLKVAGTGDAITAEWGNQNGFQFVAITLPEMKGQLGPAILDKPITIGEISGRALAFQAAVSSVGESSVVTIQFLFGDNHEQ